MKRTLAHAEARRRAKADIDQAPDDWIAECKAPTRTSDQNAKFHAICGDIAKSGATWAGKRRAPVQWKVLMVSGHAMATGEGSEMVPGLEGEFVNLRESTALMSKARSSSLVEYTLAWCATNGVEVYAEATCEGS